MCSHAQYWLWVRQEDSPLSSQSFQEVRCAQRQRASTADDAQQVWFFEEEKFPVVSNSVEEEKKHKILMKSPWEILQLPVGSGGVFSLLSSNNIPENLSEMGVECIEVCSTNPGHVGANSLLLGFVNSWKSDVGIQIFKGRKDYEKSFDFIFSTNLMTMLTKQIDKLQFYATPKQISHVEMAGKEWVDVTPSSPNSYEFGCSIYSALKACPSNNPCIMEVTE